MRKDISKLIPEKYKGSLETIISNYMPKNLGKPGSHDKFLHTYSLPNWNHEHIANMSRKIMSDKIESINQVSQQRKV